MPLLVSRHTLPLNNFSADWNAALLFALAIIFFGLSENRQNPVTPAQPISTHVPWIILCPLWLIAAAITQSFRGLEDVTGSRMITVTALALGATVAWTGWRQGRGATTEQRQDMVDVFAIAWLVAGLLGAVAQWVQVFCVELDTLGLVAPYTYPGVIRRLYGNLNQANHQATVEGLALAASVWLAVRGRLRMPAWLAAVLLLESGIVLSGSRTGVLHVGLAAAYALLAAWVIPDARSEAAGAVQPSRSAARGVMRRPAGLWFAAIAMLVLLLILQTTIRSASEAWNWHLFDTLGRLQSSDQAGARGPMWAHGWAMFRAHPWLGVGWGEFGWAQFQQLTQVGARVEMSLHAHNAVLDLMAKTGLVGASGVVVTLLAWFWRVAYVRLWKGDRQKQASTVLVLTWLAMLCTHSMLEYPLHYLYFLLPFCFLLGWLEPSGFGRWKLPRALSLAGWVAFAAIASVVLVTTWQDYRRVESREYIDGQAGMNLPMPRFWFRAYALADAAEETRITPENAAGLLAPHIAAVHLLPTPTLIARAAWLLALTGDPAEGRRWLERLRYYVGGDEDTQFAEVGRACAEVDPAARPQAFCDWVGARVRTGATVAVQPGWRKSAAAPGPAPVR